MANQSKVKMFVIDFTKFLLVFLIHSKEKLIPGKSIGKCAVIIKTDLVIHASDLLSLQCVYIINPVLNDSFLKDQQLDSLRDSAVGRRERARDGGGEVGGRG